MNRKIKCECLTKVTVVEPLEEARLLTARRRHDGSGQALNVLLSDLERDF